MKKIILSLLLVALSISSRAGIVGPDDLPTISALISLHKAMAKAEEVSVKQVGVSYGEQQIATNNASKFNELRTTLNTKLNNAHQWVILAAATSKTTLDVGNATKEYIQFVDLTRKNLFRKPQIAWYFAEANYNVSKRVSLLKKSVALMVASETNILKASLSERINMIYDIQDQVAVIRGIISQALFWSRCVSLGGFKYDYIWDILNSDVYEGIANDLIGKWKQNLDAV
jgi:hypothetical protein